MTPKEKERFQADVLNKSRAGAVKIMNKHKVENINVEIFMELYLIGYRDGMTYASKRVKDRMNKRMNEPLIR